MKNICLIILVGIPAAGKTTFCKKICNWVNPEQYIVKIYHFDEYLDNNAYHASRCKIYQLIKENIDYYCQKVNDIPILIVLDDNMMYKSMRRKYLKLAMQYEISYATIYIPISLDVAISRNNQRTNKIPQCVLTKIYNVIEIPNDAFVVNVDILDNNFFTEFIDYIQIVLKSPLKLSQLPKFPETELSIKHKVDLILRNIVSEKIKENKQWKDLNLIKTKVFESFKEGDFLLDINCSETELKAYIMEKFIKYEHDLI